ncbi:T9SS type A sorting domain-containing protein [Chitinophaga sp. GbtcB8]|uniref:T9SS type A sorting domain-containing protein n=1 Tax=Chitinophaga sp. GbtcB8 TaxID=2824753 RepID=UPI001C2F9513|nr:T9SS type A sorting domain-containing protein [Chitinophaga sp. GbtcB8]
MNKILLLFAFLSCHFFAHAQSLSLYLPDPNSMPRNNSVWQDTGINVSVVINAPAAVTSATAAAGGRQINLTGNSSSVYRGRLSLAGLPGDTLRLVIAAKDANNNMADTTIKFIYRPLNDPSITLTIDSLADSSVARPIYRLHARCTAAGGSCTITAYDANTSSNQVLGTGKDSLPWLDLTYFNGRKMGVKLVATDSLGRTAQRTVTVFVEGSPYITPHLQVNGQILDFRYNKALYIDKATGHPMLADAVTGQRTTLSTMVLNTTLIQKGFVTAQGAVWMQGGGGSIYEWKNGQIVFTTGIGYSTSFDVSNNYIAWSGNNQVGLKNLATGDTTYRDISPDTLGYFFGNISVGDNGVVALDIETFRTLYDVFKLENGQFSRLSTGSINYNPITDGKNVIYQGDGLYLYNGQNNILLGNPGTDEGGIGSGWDYQMNSNYAAFIRTGQVNLRDTSGAIRQLSTFNYTPSDANSRPKLDRLNTEGNLMVSLADSGRFYLNRAGMRTLITRIPFILNPGNSPSILSRSFYDNGQWYILIGNTVFKASVDSLPVNHISSFEKQTKPDSTLTFKPEDFASNFSGPGELVDIKFPGLPKHGLLKLNNQIVNIYYTISKADISKLVYTPDSAYTGPDTLRWVAGNGLEYTADTASVFINVTDSVITVPVPQPVISGLASTYCGAAGAQAVKILNLPATTSGIAVSVLLDGTANLPVAADSTFTILPDTLAAGTHTITVTFEHDTTQKQLTREFTITAPVTPDVSVTVNVNPITTDTIPVVITAANAGGGGKLPLYTFAWDRNFTDQIQMESTNDNATVQPSEFKLGDNWVYVRMRSSDNCTTTSTATDSIRINKTNITAIVDVNAPGRMIHIYPNPFRGQLTLKGFQPTGTYIISLYNAQGRLLKQQRIVNNTQVQLQVPATSGNIYLLNIYDEKNKKMLGTEKLLGY